MSLQRFTLDLATEADLPELIALLAELFAIEQDFSADPAKQERGLRLLLQQPPRQAAIHVARDAAGRAIAMVSTQLVVSTAEGAPSAWIEDMVVSAGWRRRGVGNALLAAALEWARSRGATRAQLLVDLGNPPALAYYDSLGWQPTRLGARRVFLAGT